MERESLANHDEHMLLRRVIELEAKNQRYESEIDTPVRVKVNGKEIDIQQTQTLRAHGVEQQGMYVKVEIPEVGVQVYFDGFAATIKMSKMYRNAQCGLCGHYDGEETDEFRTADNELTEDVEKFHRSFFHQDEECQINEQIVDDDKQYEYQPFVWENEEEQYRREQQYRRRFDSNEERESKEFRNSKEIRDSKEVRDSKEEREDSNEEERSDFYKNKFEQRIQRPRLVTKVIEQAHELCFSMKPVPQCPSNTYATKFDEEKKVSFACLPRSDSEAHSLYRLASTNKIVQTEQLKASFVETVLIPQECRQF